MLRVREFLQKLDYKLDKAFPVWPGFVAVNKDDMQGYFEKIDSLVPEDIKEAERILKSCDDMVIVICRCGFIKESF